MTTEPDSETPDGEQTRRSSHGSSATFVGVQSGDCECFCWDDVPQDECDKIRQEPEWIKSDPELRERDGRLYPGDVLRFLGCEDGKRYRFTITVEAVD